ncbi:hypothetical protein [Actinomadura darangshiensis]|uniref:hypothetical protein n=1 Tax=Actinomadura darangshiensis TaxID=705336 RepID=UPI001A9F8F01|nr:hypothetical protein [Actinomadura darangshiensis]
MTDTIIKPGTRLHSQVCGTGVIVVRPGSPGLDLRCGGVPMSASADRAMAGEPRSPFDGGSLLGKRYTHPDDDSLELLVTSPGAGTLSDGDTPLVVKEAKPLPASD